MKINLHSLLARQLKKADLTPEKLPKDLKQWASFLEAINRAYIEVDQERYIVERSMHLSSKEMSELYEKLRKSSEQQLTIEKNRLQLILASMKDGLFTLDASGRLALMNSEAEVLLGYKEPELIGKKILDFIETTKNWNSALGLGRTVFGDANFIKKDKTRLPVSFVLSPLVSSNKLQGHVLVFHDITLQLKEKNRMMEVNEELERRVKERTSELVAFNEALNSQINERKKAEEQALAQSSRLFALLESFPAGNVIQDESDNILHVNKKFCEILGIQKEPPELVGLGLKDTLKLFNLKLENWDAFVGRIKKIIEDKEVVLREIISTVDGRVLERDFIPIIVHGIYKGHLWQYRDITESRLLQQRLSISDRMASVGTLAAGVAHEINNPLSYVMMNVEALEEYCKQIELPDSEAVQEVLNEIAEGVSRVRDIVRDLKTFSHENDNNEC